MANNLSFIFSHGLYAGEVQLGKYVKKFISSSNEEISNGYGVDIINNSVSSAIYNEIVLYNGFTFNPFKLIQYFYLKMHQRKHRVVVNYNNKLSMWAHSIDYRKINFGQSDDIATLQNIYNQHVQKYPNTKIIMYGVSRGAATVFNWLSKNKNQIDLTMIKGVILEGVYDDIRNIFPLQWWYNLSGRICNFFGYNNVCDYLLEHITKYRFDGESPLKSVSEYPDNLPTLIITSKEDDVIPHSSTLNLYNEIVKNNKKCSIVILDKSTHSEYMYNNDSDKTKYINSVNLFINE